MATETQCQRIHTHTQAKPTTTETLTNVYGDNSPADSVPPLQHNKVCDVVFEEVVGGRQARHARPHDDNLAGAGGLGIFGIIEGVSFPCVVCRHRGHVYIEALVPRLPDPGAPYTVAAATQLFIIMYLSSS